MQDTKAGTMPVALRRLLFGDVVSAAGIGLTQPYLVILLHSDKGIPLAAATAMTALLALASFPGNWLSGVLTDRHGGRLAMTAGLATTVCGLVLVAAGGHPLLLGCAVAAVGFGWAVTLPAYATLIAGLVPEEAHGRTFTLQFALFNAGMGAGSAAAVLVADLPWLWWAAAGTCLVAIVAVRGSYTGGRRGTKTVPDAGYRALLADRRLLRVLAVAVLTSAAGYGVYTAGLPVLAIHSGHPDLMSWASVANCLTIVAGLPLALHAGVRLTPPRLVAATAAVWSAAWLLCATVTGPAWVVLPLAAVLMGAGELLLSGALPAMVNALAPDALRGRYNAALTFAMTAGMWAGPLLAAAATALGLVWLLFAAAVALLAAATVLVHRVQDGPAAAGQRGVD
ncbi:MFS transporter [Dactylosporangium sp. NPDC000521]|uniref:MFS transporter n=1 Tax=Dactylosporangium sp. NPDC000521 TaxID=3363975 RepID=UPI0036B691E3